MKNKELYLAIVDILKNLGYKIRKDVGSFNGGACYLREEKVIVLNKNYPLEIHLSILASVLYQHQNEIFIKPNVRDFIEKEGKNISSPIEIIVVKSE